MPILKTITPETDSRTASGYAKALAAETSPAIAGGGAMPARREAAFPKPERACFYGLAGKLALAVDPFTEADPFAVFVNVLTAFGSMAGRSCHFSAGGGRHHANLFVGLVGNTAAGRKGTSWSTVAPALRMADETWFDERRISGLATGEGLIHQIRDPRREWKDGELVETDGGVPDKRLFCLEEELARPFRVMRREGNTLSAVLRAAWDGSRLNVATKTASASAINSHVSIVGHITREELAREMTENDITNGLSNRFLWFAIRRSKCLPETPRIDAEILEDFGARMSEALRWARAEEREITRDPDARKRWAEIYPALSGWEEHERSGVTASILARDVAQVTRISLLLSMLDRSPVVSVPHLEAALAVWRYAEASAAWIFGATATGQRNPDAILEFLRRSGRPVSRTDITGEVFKRNQPSEKIDGWLQLLHERGFAAPCPPPDGKRGEFWRAI